MFEVTQAGKGSSNKLKYRAHSPNSILKSYRNNLEKLFLYKSKKLNPKKSPNKSLHMTSLDSHFAVEISNKKHKYTTVIKYPICYNETPQDSSKGSLQIRTVKC